MYEYKCHKCGQVFELIQRFSDAPLTVHDACGGELEKVISAPAFHLKGSGWYATDYAKGSGKKPAPKAGDGDSKDGADKKDGAAKTETSTATKTESTPAPATPAATKESSTK
jgi:putative FmdB family regulatory protein